MALEVQKRVKNAVLYKCGHIRIDNVRASYPHLAKAHAGDDGGEPKFSIAGLLDKKTHKEAIALIKEAIESVKKANPKVKIPASKVFLKDGDEEYADKEECVGHMVVAAREKKRPMVRDADKNEVEKEDIEELIYAGCRVDILINPWVQNNSFGKRINANLRSVKFRKDDAPFGTARVDDSDAWDDDDDGFNEDDDI